MWQHTVMKLNKIILKTVLYFKLNNEHIDPRYRMKYEAYFHGMKYGRHHQTYRSDPSCYMLTLWSDQITLAPIEVMCKCSKRSHFHYLHRFGKKIS